MSAGRSRSPRAAALAGPYGSGKTTLLESILAQTGAVKRKGSIKDGTTAGDGAPEARAHQMTTELNIARTAYLDENWTFLDCPGSVEFGQDAVNAVMAADVCVAVCEPAPEKAPAAGPLLRFLNENSVPHIVFINKMDAPGAGVKAALEALQEVSARPLVLREIPIRENGAVTGHVDLVSERAFKWTPGSPSDLIPLPESAAGREAEARGEMLESIADFDDAILEQLLEDAAPGAGAVYDSLAKDLRENLIAPVFFGAAESGAGVRRLLKALRHEAPGISETAERLGAEPDAGGGPVARVFKTFNAGHTGKLSAARVMHGEVKEGGHMGGARPSGLFHIFGQKHEKAQGAKAGDVIAFGRLNGAETGDLLNETGKAEQGLWPAPLAPLYALAVTAESRADEVKLSQSLQKILEEDPSLRAAHDGATGEYVLSGQGEMHLKIACERLKNRSGVSVRTVRPQAPYQETVRRPASRRARHKKQSGGHGEFGDVQLEIKPLDRGAGFVFSNTIHGGAVPKQYIPAVEAGVKEYMAEGPLGFPVTDIAVTLTDGQHHSVDSSEMAFKKAAAQAMREAVPEASPVLLEPVHRVRIFTPAAFTAKIQRIIAGRRGQITGFDARAGWPGWDRADCLMPLAEMHDLIIELRSATLGTGAFEHEFDHMQELSGKEAEQAAARRAART